MIIGWVLLVIGLTLKVVTLFSLKENSTWRIKKPYTLVTTGMYKHIRHPIYLAELIGYFGLSLLLTKSFGISIMLLITILKFFLDRIDREENLLADIYGQEYLKYFKSTKMLIPFLL